MRRFERAATPAAALVVLALASASPAPGELPFLLDLPATRTSAASVRYTPGSLDRASHVQTRLGLLAHDFGRWTGNKMPLHAYLLSRQEWEALGVRIPYGLPARLPDGALVLSAWGDGQTVALWRALLAGALPELEGTPLRGTPEEASSLLALDLLAQIEASRTLVGRAGYRAAEPRIYDLLAHAVAAGAFSRHESARGEAIARVFRRLAVADPAADSPQAELRRLLGRQARTFLAAQRIVAARGEDGVRRLFKLAKKSDGPLDAQTLGRKFPELTAWLEAAGQPVSRAG